MKKLIVLLSLFIFTTMNAQTLSEDVKGWGEGWKYAFSSEGRQAWKPEFTIRRFSGFFTDGNTLTGGVKIDDKRTFGLMASQAETHYDAVPGDVCYFSLGLYMRRYFHLGKKDIVALYSDCAVGGGYVYKVKNKYITDADTGEKVEMIDENPGDLLFVATWQPGVRIRFWKNLHLFLGPTLSTDTIGFHLGVGF